MEVFLPTKRLYQNAAAYAEQVAPKLEYLMSIDIKLAPSVVIDKNMRITQVASGVVNGPNIRCVF